MEEKENWCSVVRRKVVEAASGRRQAEKPWETNAASPVKGCSAAQLQRSAVATPGEGIELEGTKRTGTGTGNLQSGKGDGANKEEDGLG